ncbi:hypothetical protein ATN84_10875 [Paramesorhizobium deserti]|uniref:Uncharacterized protein n=2 Tax=Paramesorhizobium deserti TaxID=1494590 RepID=A0A135HTR4_9HYPH|nr:hypothetical protein ATN84_10875 [Paramesorhizobium deserti]
MSTSLATMAQSIHMNSSFAAPLMLSEGNAADPLFDLWREWLAVHAETLRCCKRQQQLEAQLMAEAEIPRVEIILPERPKRFGIRGGGFRLLAQPIS